MAVSTTEAEYILLLMSLQDVIPAMELVAEIKAKGFPVLCTKPYVYCKVFEDNSGALELACLPKFRPRTKHINTMWHHFREHVRLDIIKLFPCSSQMMTVDALTKLLPQHSFVRHHVKMMGH